MCLLFYFVLSKPIQPFLWGFDSFLRFCFCLNLNLNLLFSTSHHLQLLRDFILESEAGAVRGKGVGKATPRLSVIGRTKDGCVYLVSTSHHKEYPSLGMQFLTYHPSEHAAAPCSLRRPNQPSVSVLCCTFKEPSSL